MNSIKLETVKFDYQLSVQIAVGSALLLGIIGAALGASGVLQGTNAIPYIVNSTAASIILTGFAYANHEKLSKMLSSVVEQREKKSIKEEAEDIVTATEKRAQMNEILQPFKDYVKQKKIIQQTKQEEEEKKNQEALAAKKREKGRELAQKFIQPEQTNAFSPNMGIEEIFEKINRRPLEPQEIQGLREILKNNRRLKVDLEKQAECRAITQPGYADKNLQVISAAA